MNEGRKEVIETLLKRIETKHGKGTVMILDSANAVQKVEVIPTGSLSLDIATGVGGYPRGRIIEIYGPESSGKTTLALHAIAEIQKMGGFAAFVDTEHALDPTYARALGVNTSSLIISQPDYGEQALEIMDEFVRSGAIDLIVLDSVAALVPKAELEGAMGDMQVGLHARLMSQALRKLAGSVSKSKAVVIFINQTRMRIGVSYGNPETTTGGMALKFYASMRIEVKRRESIKDTNKEVIGYETTAKIVKNKVAPPFRTAVFDVIFGRGIVRENELINLGLKEGLVLKKGSWFYYKSADGTDYTLGQGKMNAAEYLRENPNLAEEIEKGIRVKYGLLVEEEKEKAEK